MAIQYVDKKHNGTIASPTAITDTASNRQYVQNRPEAAGLAYDRAQDALVYNGADAIRTVLSGVARVNNLPTVAFTLTAAQSGTVVFLGTTDGFEITLPAPAAGLNYKFIVSAAFANANYVVKTAAGAAIIEGVVDVAGTLVEADNEKQINFVATAENVGDWASVISDGTSWMLDGVALTAGAITVTAP